MNNKTPQLISIMLIMLFAFSCSTPKNQGLLINNIREFNNAVKHAKPGDQLVLANGIWKDVELVFQAKGTKDNPIILSAEDKGKVILQGQSNLQIAGEHLIVKGLVFKNGFTPTNAVISFRKNKNELANNCRLTECVIDNYNNPERHVQDYWVTIYGKNNRIDHNHIVGKKNLGVTMIVGLDTEASRENHHKIDHNYFGPRPTFGNNGGETLRIGTSHYALKNSNTLVESNYFDRCNGEHEIISNKSCKNTFKYNTFFECTGTLTMRHGNETLVDSNVFLGNGKPSTGGVRVINESQTVINNYHYGLTGYRFRGAFVMMNGVPNSPPNRYVQVSDSRVSDNIFVNCDHIQLCAGSDAERSAPPVNSLISNNIFYHDKKEDLFTIYDDISGIAFNNNEVSKNIEVGILEGFVKKEFELVKNNGFLIPTLKNTEPKVNIHKDIATKTNTGVPWYKKENNVAAFNSGKIIEVASGINTLFNAVNMSSPGDVLQLEAGKTYKVTKSVKVKHPITVKTMGSEKSTILFERMMAFEISDGGSLNLDNIKFDGASSPDYAGNSVISTSKTSMINNYKLFVNNCTFQNLVVNHSFDVLRVAKGTFADTISITNSTFKNITGHIASLDKETDDIGAYNAEYIIMKNNIISNVQGAALRLYRGGTDESTFGPFLEFENNTIDNVGHGKKNKFNTAMSLYGVQVNYINNNIFNNSKGLNMHLVVGEPIVNVLNNNFYNSGEIGITGDQVYNVENLWHLKPDLNETTLQLEPNSVLKHKGTHGNALGATLNK
ncbi:alginate lyase [Tamlana nanhaiensis]|uniref:Alginate lyase n=1 Tax=Neotamlana nanhaiensis TaxID=1382798 RepID=A0A0D7W0T2_9FLAO|nr:polysaccharide lyase 6 family protein [Tamlana nanhaiensis]KJD31452.1 alginate lyase [Tamlana nanhaiensis]